MHFVKIFEILDYLGVFDRSILLLLIIATIINNYNIASIGLSPFFFTYRYYINIIRLNKDPIIVGIL
jgi:hypothetical protein